MMVVVLLALAFVPMTAQASDDDSSDVTIELTGADRDTLQVGVKNMYKIVVTGGPGNTTGGNYTWSGTLGGDLGDDATISPSVGGPSTTGIFYFNLTAPDSAGGFTLKIVVKSVNSTANESQTLKVSFKARDPILLTAIVQNTANVTVSNVPVYFYLNDDSDQPEEIYNTTVSVDALSKETIFYNWTSYDLSSGEHEIKVMIDPDSEFVTLNDGNSTVSTMTVYYDVHGYGTVNAWLWTFAAILAVILLFIYTRPAKRKKKKKKR
jgi:hypothetical protein